MKLYTFKMTPSIFMAGRKASYSEIEHKKINEYIEDITLKVESRDLNEANKIATTELAIIIETVFGKEILDYYGFGIKILSVEVS